MQSYTLKGIFFYKDNLTFAQMASVESQILELLEELFFNVSCFDFVTESLTDSFTLSCMLPILLPLKFLDQLSDSLVTILDDGTTGKFLLFTQKLDCIQVSYITHKGYTLQHIDARLKLQHKKDPLPNLISFEELDFQDFEKKS
ncbi:MAG: hypothetical protein ACRCV3_01305 [Desulfovibrionaceae bacterium]